METQVANPTLADVLDPLTTIGSLWQMEDERIRCVACGHRCLIGEGQRGICKVRFNEGGPTARPFRLCGRVQCDPVEKKPFFHVYPGSDALTFGMMGCDLHCSYCQNWVTSRLCAMSAAVAPVRPVTPGQLVEAARRERARLVVSSYNEPLITAEWAVAVFEEAKAAGLACAFVSNGNATPEVLDFLQPWIVAYKVDLKSFDDRALSHARRHARQHHRYDPHDSRAQHLAGNRDAGHSRASTTATGAAQSWPDFSPR